MKDTKKMIIILLTIVGIILLTLILGGGIYIINQQSKEKDYRQQIETAQKYLLDGDYDLAIATYTKAISKNPKDADAYIGLSNIYIQLGDYNNALIVLENGYKATGSKRISALIEYFNSMELDNSEDSVYANTNMDNDVTVKQIKDSVNISWNLSMLEKMQTYNYGDFNRDYGTGEIVFDEEYLMVVYNDEGVTCYYRNTDSNKSIVDTVRSEPFSYAMPEKISFDNLGKVFNDFEGEISNSTLKNLIGREISCEKIEGRNAVKFEYKNCVFIINTDEDGNIKGFDAVNEIILLNANNNSNGNDNVDCGTVSGYVVNALNEPIVGATIQFTNKTDRTVKVDNIQTTTGGAFKIELPVGEYEIKILASMVNEMYVDETFTVKVTKDCNITGEIYVIGIKSEGILRIVLDWGMLPYDLDSYLTGNCNGEEIFVSYFSRTDRGNSYDAQLDVDVTSGYGPETITFNGDIDNSDISYTVVDFAHTGSLGQSNARVRIYWTDGSIYEAAVPTNAENYWTVFRITNGELVMVNDISERTFDNWWFGSIY